MNIKSLLQLLAVSSTLTLTACGGGGSDSDSKVDNVQASPVDTDKDGVADKNDAFPTDPNEQRDSDGDGTGDNADAFPNDASEHRDTDGDGIGDNADAFPNNAAEQHDTDGDGTGDNADVFPDDASEHRDTDLDGVGDNADAFPNNPDEQYDTDGDGVGDNKDVFPNDPTEQVDTDGDGVGDNADCAPDNALLSVLNSSGSCAIEPSETAASFNLAGAVTVVTTENTATKATAAQGVAFAAASDDGRTLNTYVFHDSSEAVTAKSKYFDLVEAGMSQEDAAVSSQGPSTNLFVIDENGDLQFALDSEYDVKISYSVVWQEKIVETDGDTESVTYKDWLFFAVDSFDPWYSAKFMYATGNCGIFKVDVETGDWSCVEPTCWRKTSMTLIVKL